MIRYLSARTWPGRKRPSLDVGGGVRGAAAPGTPDSSRAVRVGTSVESASGCPQDGQKELPSATSWPQCGQRLPVIWTDDTGAHEDPWRAVSAVAATGRGRIGTAFGYDGARSTFETSIWAGMAPGRRHRLEVW